MMVHSDCNDHAVPGRGPALGWESGLKHWDTIDDTPDRTHHSYSSISFVRSLSGHHPRILCFVDVLSGLCFVD